MRVLFVASRFPYPPLRGDQARAWHQLRLLAARHRLTLLVDRGGQNHEGLRQLEALGVELVPVATHLPGRAYGFARGLLRGQPAQTALFASAALERRLAELLAERRHDLLHVQLARLEPIVPVPCPLPVVVDLIDALSLNMRRRGRRQGLAVGLAANLEARRLQRLEQEICARRDCVTVVSRTDREVLGDFENVFVNPNGVDLGRFRPGPERDPRQVVFTGNQGYFPNVDAALWFAREIWPLVRRAQPAATFTIAGDRPAATLRRLANTATGIHVTGHVADLPGLLAAAAVAVAPLRSGSGQLFKVLEALACETPVVATPLALAGTSLESGRHVLAGESPADFAGALVRLLADPGLRAGLGAAGRSAVVAQHAWETSVAGLEALYERALAQRRSVSA